MQKRSVSFSLTRSAGGFWTDTSSSADPHNDAVIDYLADYKDSIYIWPGTSGEFIGVFGFDEPDARYEGPGWNQCQYNTEWFDLMEDYAQASRDSISDDILPFGTFLDRWCTKNGTLWYQETIPLFCEELEYPIFDKYPCKYSSPDDRTFPDQIEFDEIIGTTDLIPSDSVDYNAYADQDEIFAVDDDGWFRVYQFDNVTSHTDTIEVSRIDSILLPSSLRDDPIWAASDYRAVDVGDRDSDLHRLNGAVVFINPDDPNDNLVVFHDDTDLVFLDDTININGNLPATTAVCVGEYNYTVHHTTSSSRQGSLISHGELRILVCYKSREGHDTVDRARVFAWDYTNEEFDDVTGDSLGLELEFEPVKAVWGVFWPTYNYWQPYNSDDQSGFIVLDSSGNYRSIYEYVQGSSIPEWTVSDEFSNLFDWDETSFIARRTLGFPCYTAGMDYICHLIQCGTEEEAVLEFASDPGGSPNSALTVYESSPFDLPASYDFTDINGAASCRPLTFYDDALLVSFDDGSGGSEVYKSTSQINFQGGDDISITMDSDTLSTLDTDESPLLAAARVYNVRQPYRVPIVFNPTVSDPFQIELLNGDIPVESSSDFFADQHVALDTMFVYGIDGTSRSNCLIHNLRCEGRRQDGQLTFYPSSDTLLYLMTTSLVHGCRGIHVRALDITMMCGNGGGAAPSGTYRSPPLLLNWGPSVETTNPDMIGRLHDVVQSLTGKNTSNPDFISALIDEDYAILDTASVRNAIFEDRVWYQDIDNDYLNFIAVEDSVSGDILLMVVNDSDAMLFDNKYIRFPDHFADSYTANWVAGFKCDIDAPESEIKLLLDFELMPAYSASLYWFEHI